MPLKEIKNDWQHYYENDAGQKHGEFKWYHKNGKLWVHCHFKNGDYHGEYKKCNDSGKLRYHVYDVNNAEVHNFLDDGDSEFIRVCLYMTYGAPWLT